MPSGLAVIARIGVAYVEEWQKATYGEIDTGIKLVSRASI
jgi:hypothetical protein